MSIDPINRLRPVTSLNDVATVDIKPESGSSGVSFKGMLKDAVGEVNNLQGEADTLAVKLASGDMEDVHRAMIAMQKAKLALDLTIQVRNKVIDAYQEIMRMQV
jgi:flagellar hook-basal body complex protein FliE